MKTQDGVRLKVDSEEGALYWSNVDGWGDRESATLFDDEEAASYEVRLMALLGGYDLKTATIEPA